MRSGLLCVLIMAGALGGAVQAEESEGSEALHLSGPAGQLADLQQRLKDSEQQRETLLRQVHNADLERDGALLSRLRQENQRLKLQLKEAQAALPRRLLSDQQQWFVAGGGVAMIALLCGIFASGWRRQRRQWLN
jgi:hypothetical protein